MDKRDVLERIDGLLKKTLHPISYRVNKYSELMSLPVEEGVERAREAYLESGRGRPLDEGSFWGMNQRTAQKRLIFAVYAYAKEHGDIPLDGEELYNAMVGSLMDAADNTNELANRLLNETSYKNM